MSGQKKITVEVIEAVAKVDKESPHDVDYTLTEFVDPDLLENLATSKDNTWTFSFQLSDHQVTLNSRGQLFVDGQLYRENCLVPQENTS